MAERDGREWHRLMERCPAGHENGPLFLRKSNNWTEWVRRQRFDEHRSVCRACGKFYTGAEYTYRLLPEDEPLEESTPSADP